MKFAILLFCSFIYGCADLPDLYRAKEKFEKLSQKANNPNQKRKFQDRANRYDVAIKRIEKENNTQKHHFVPILPETIVPRIKVISELNPPKNTNTNQKTEWIDTSKTNDKSYTKYLPKETNEPSYAKYLNNNPVETKPITKESDIGIVFLIVIGNIVIWGTLGFGVKKARQKWDRILAGEFSYRFVDDTFIAYNDLYSFCFISNQWIAYHKGRKIPSDVLGCGIYAKIDKRFNSIRLEKEKEKEKGKEKNNKNNNTGKYYSILGLNPNDALTKEKLNRAFHKRAMQTHPDKKGGNAEEFKAVNEAYENLLKKL